jgi:hypothetical protein
MSHATVPAAPAEASTAVAVSLPNRQAEAKRLLHALLTTRRVHKIFSVDFKSIHATIAIQPFGTSQVTHHTHHTHQKGCTARGAAPNRGSRIGSMLTHTLARCRPAAKPRPPYACTAWTAATRQLPAIPVPAADAFATIGCLCRSAAAAALFAYVPHTLLHVPSASHQNAVACPKRIPSKRCCIPQAHPISTLLHVPSASHQNAVACPRNISSQQELHCTRHHPPTAYHDEAPKARRWGVGPYNAPTLLTMTQT